MSESGDLRTYLSNAGLEIRNVIATEGLLLGRPSRDGGLGRPSWVLYESGSVVLRHSADVADAFEAAEYHLRSLAAATESDDRLAILARVLILPNGRAWLTDPYVSSQIGGLERRFLRAGTTVLPTTIASIDPVSSEVVLPEHGLGGSLPSGRFPIDRLLFRTIPGETIDGVEELRLARLVVRHNATDLPRTLSQISEIVARQSGRLQLLPASEIEHEINQLTTASTRHQ